VKLIVSVRPLFSLMQKAQRKKLSKKRNAVSVGRCPTPHHNFWSIAAQNSPKKVWIKKLQNKRDGSL
jgi:hypothetical protein